ncbi:MAG TPA: cyclic beta 1-2 glucan synthetase, partial [Chitinophagaceae bacterium]|nr:cyclic beta 1-2 glucan synthetase [Chitinophagaceae bacterium]
MSNSISSLRFLAKMDWREFVERMSIVEQTLHEDVYSVYSKMDFYTRDSYRHVVEKLAKKTNLDEKEIAQMAVELAKKSAEENPGDLRRAHVGYYLVGKGVLQIEKKAAVKLPAKDALKKFISSHNRAWYIISFLLLTFSIAFLLFLKAYTDDEKTGLLVGVGILSVISASHLALLLVNWITTILVQPKQLPRMDYSSGIPNDQRTLVAIPAMLTDLEQTEKLVEELEVRFLANRDPNLLFALLTDFKDADEESLPEDEGLVAFAVKKIEALNSKYGRKENDTFFFFHRPRKWNAKEGVWMGWERKRGKLAELNALLKGKEQSSFSVIIGEEKIYTTVKYVITLDTDTQLPREAAWKLTGIMAHPLNHAEYNAKKKRITEGYGVVQPRIAISLHGATRSLFSHMHENDSGIDPYTRVTSDVYQDLFAEGSFIGKGIYDVDVFEKLLNNRFPENRILSHDLLEGAYTRCAFASDVQLYEEYPSSYSIDINRRHRWIRGDWQIANWFLNFVPDSKGRLRKNPVSALSRFKIFDNLRRSLVPVALFILLTMGWTILSSGWFWTLCVTGIIFLSPVLISAWGIIKKPEDVLLRHHIKNSAGATWRNVL